MDRKGEPVNFERQPETIDSDTRRQICSSIAQAFGADRSKLLSLLLANSCVRPAGDKN